MKRILVLVVAFLAVGHLAFAQGEKSLKAASKAFSEYSKDPFANTAALEQAQAYLEEAFQDEAIASDPGAWLTRGEIFFNSGDSQVKGRLLNPTAALTDPSAGIKSFEAYKKALELSEKKKDIKNALKGLANAENLLNNMGVEAYKDQDYISAYKSFSNELMASEVLKANDQDSRLDDNALLTEKYFFAGLTAYYAEDYQKSIDYLVNAKETGTEDATVFQIIYESYKSLEKAEEGLPFLEEGREKFPDDNGLLFSEINHYLASGELDKMIGKLEVALEKEPDNQSVILTLGQVYDQLQVKSQEAGETEKAQEYFDSAFSYYTKALENTPEDFDLNYSVGALYYNKAAGMTPALNAVAEDFSKEGEAKYNAIKDQMAGLFDQALPYFLKADSINGEDRNTLIALKEIMARKDEFEKSNAYKERLEALGGN